MKDYDYEIKELADNSFELILLNIWNKETLNKNIKAINTLNIPKNSKLTVNFQNLKECDSSAIIYLISFFRTFPQENITLENLLNYEKKYRFYEKHYQDNSFELEEKSNIFENIGKKTHEIYISFIDFTNFIG